MEFEVSPDSRLVDDSRPLTAKEVQAFSSRDVRLRGAFGNSAKQATDRFNASLGAPGHLSGGLRVRVPFSCLTTPIAETEVSDRKAPRLELRPPATRILTSQGVALRLYLTVLAAAQVETKAGRQFDNRFPITGASDQLGWDDLVATGAEPSGRGRTYSLVRDKKARSIRSGLDNLERAGLVTLVGDAGKRGRHGDFVVLNEMGRQNPGDPIRYAVPRTKDAVIALPPQFVMNGWLNILEDSEIAVLLMVACGCRSLPVSKELDVATGEVAIPGEDRLRYYGLHRDPYASARKTLEWFGLIKVREVMRHLGDGRGEDGATQLHRISVAWEGFEADAYEVVPGVLQAQLDRVKVNRAP